MRLTLRQLQIFRAIAQTGSTTAAAERIALSQSAVSAALNELEQVLGVRLFDRIGKRLLLNDSGRALLPGASALLEGAHSLEHGFPAGQAALQIDLRLAASTTLGNYVLPSWLAGFRARIPNARIQLRIGNTREVASVVSEFEADLGLIEGPCHAPDMSVIPLQEDELVIFAAPEHPLARAGRRARLTVKQLRQAAWLLREPGSGTREAVEQALLPSLQQLQEDMALGSSEAIKNAVAQGMGISCLSRHVIRDLLDARRLTILPTTLPRLSRRFALIHHRSKLLSPALQAFVEHCTEAGAASA